MMDVDVMRMPTGIDPIAIERALYEQSEINEAERQRATLPVGLGRREVRNLFTPAAYEDALRRLNDPEPLVREFAQRWLAKRNSAVGHYCQNLSCCQWFPASTGRGRPRLFCSSRCKDAAAKRAQRNAKNPGRREVLPSFDLLPAPREGFAGGRRYRRLPTDGFRSIATAELSQRLHNEVVSASGPPRVNSIIEEFLDGAWTQQHQKALEKRGSLRDQIEEYRAQRAAARDPLRDARLP